MRPRNGPEHTEHPSLISRLGDVEAASIMHGVMTQRTEGGAVSDHVRQCWSGRRGAKRRDWSAGLPLYRSVGIQAEDAFPRVRTCKFSKLQTDFS